MAKGIRLQPVIPQIAYDQLMQEVETTGLSVSNIISHLILKGLPKVHSKAQKAVDPQKRLLELRKRLKPYIDKWEERTITRKEVEIMDKLTTEIREVKAEMGETLPVVNRVAEFDQKRQNAELLVNQMEHELDQLQTLSRMRPLEPDDQYRVKELLGLIPQAKRDLEINYPLE